MFSDVSRNIGCVIINFDLSQIRMYWEVPLRLGVFFFIMIFRFVFSYSNHIYCFLSFCIFHQKKKRFEINLKIELTMGQFFFQSSPISCRLLLADLPMSCKVKTSCFAAVSLPQERGLISFDKLILCFQKLFSIPFALQ